MSKPLPYTRAQPYRLDTLQTALQAAGVAIETIYATNLENTRIVVVVGDAQAEAPVAAVVTAHDETQRPAWEVAAEADQADLIEFRESALQAAQLLGWNPATQQWAAAGQQWDALTPAQRTVFMRRVVRALWALAKRQVGVG